MRLLALLGLLLVVGCATSPVPNGAVAGGVPLAYENPVLVPVTNPGLVYETTVDVLDDYFRIEHEVPVRVVGNVTTEGSIETHPEIGSTWLEPWRHDSADSYNKWEATLQTIRRYAKVRLFPDPCGVCGLRVEVAVFKELENVVHPESSTFVPNEATFRYDTSMTRIVAPVGEQEINQGWIPLGRDPALEQRIIGQILARVGSLQPR